MTERERFKWRETHEIVMRRDRYTCQSCHGSVRRYDTEQLAHRVPKTDANIEKYGKPAIHHPLNLAAACSLECNNRVQLHATKWDKHMEIVYESMRNEL